MRDAVQHIEIGSDFAESNIIEVNDFQNSNDHGAMI